MDGLTRRVDRFGIVFSLKKNHAQGAIGKMTIPGCPTKRRVDMDWSERHRKPLSHNFPPQQSHPDGGKELQILYLC